MFNRRRALFLLIPVPLVLGVGGWFAFGGGGPQAATTINTGSDNVAIRGYDPVAYFELSAPKKGDPNIAHRWSDAIWQFSSKAHRDMFAREPERFAPSYGGYCAMGMADGFIANIDPEAWAIVDGRLYLSRNKKLMEERWRPDPSEQIARADANWQGEHATLKNVWSEDP